MRGAVCRWPFRAATDLLSRRGAGGNNKAALQERRRKSEAISGNWRAPAEISRDYKGFLADRTVGSERGVKESKSLSCVSTK